MAHQLPPIMKIAERLQLAIESAVRAMARFHKYHVGSDLRRAAADAVKLCNRAWRDRTNQAHWVGKLVWAIDELKLTLQMGSGLRAFRSFGEFESLIRMAEDFGRQAGGWKRQLHQGQNASAITPEQRAQTLSTRVASAPAGANP